MADLFGAVTDDAVNRIINFAHARAPYLFNYVAPTLQAVLNDQGAIVGFQELWLTCSPVPDPPPNVPKYRRMKPFQLPGIPVKLPFSLQLIDLNLDFHPSDAVTLPVELGPPLAAQRFALEATVQFGLACVPPQIISALANQTFAAVNQVQVSILPVTTLDCFLLKVVATGHLTVKPPAPGSGSTVEEIRLEIDGIEIVDLSPVGLEHVVECYVTAMLKGYVLPKTVLALQQVAVNTLGVKAVKPSLSTGLPNNPAIEQNQVRVWLDLAFS